MSLITTATWVRRGFAAPFPTKYNFDDAEFERVAQLARLQLDDARDELKEAQKGKEDVANELSNNEPAEGTEK
jgi:periodic tryptophan protein 1